MPRKNSLVISKTNINGFKVGLEMEGIQVPVILQDNNFSSCITALSLVRDNSHLSIESSSFNSSNIAILTRYLSGQFHLSSSTIEMCNTALALNHGYSSDETASVLVERCVLRKNKKAFTLAGRTYGNLKRMEITFSHSVFEEDANVGDIDLWRRYTTGVFFYFQNNTVTKCQNGISFQSNNQDNLVVVQNNTFVDGGNGTVLNADGQTEFSGNTISNWTFPDGSLVTIKYLKNQCELRVHNNTITKNMNSRKII